MSVKSPTWSWTAQVRFALVRSWAVGATARTPVIGHTCRVLQWDASGANG